MKKLSFLFVLIIVTLQVKAQSIPGGLFTVSAQKGCAPLNVTVTAPACDGSILCLASFGNGTIQPFNDGDILPYSTAGTFTLKIVFSTFANDSLTIQVFPNTPPLFELYACSGNEAQVKIVDTNYDQYIINYNNTPPEVTVPRGSLAKDTHIFPSGSQTVNVRGKNLSSADNCTPATQTINVTNALTQAAITQLDVPNASSIKLDFNNPPTSNQLNTVYQLQIAPNSSASTSFRNFSTIYNTQTTSVSNSIQADDNYYCFRMGTIDVCNSATAPISYSNIICSANFDLTVKSDSIKMNWITSNINATGFSISKSIGTAIPPLLPSATKYADGNIICNTDYTYKLTTHYLNYGTIAVTSNSMIKPGKSFSDIIPSTIENISAVVTETGATLTWLQDPVSTPTEYTITKSTKGSFSFLGNSITPAYIDASYLTESNSCYKISYLDACLNASDQSAEACPMRLTGSLLPGNEISVSWSPYTGWINPVDHYELQKFDAQGNAFPPIDVGLATTYADDPQDFNNQQFTYVVTAFASDVSVTKSISNEVTITKVATLTYPTAFTPNGDPNNPVFKVFGQYVSSFEMNIYNRWGEIMYSSSSQDQGWDGTYKGNLMPLGTYVFTAKIVDLLGRTVDQSGTVVLLK